MCEIKCIMRSLAVKPHLENTQWGESNIDIVLWFKITNQRG